MDWKEKNHKFGKDDRITSIEFISIKPKREE